MLASFHQLITINGYTMNPEVFRISKVLYENGIRNGIYTEAPVARRPRTTLSHVYLFVVFLLITILKNVC